MKLKTELLKNGKVQVRFEYLYGPYKGHYGYLMVDSESSEEVMSQLIEGRIKENQNKGDYGVSLLSKMVSPLYL